MKNFILVIIVALQVSCQKPGANHLVRVGSLRAIMHQGMLQANASIDTIDMQNVYGVGALDSLSGELIILNGTAFVSKVDRISASVEVTETTGALSPLMVYTRIEQWDTISMVSQQPFERLISDLGKSKGFDDPFAFMVIGAPEFLQYHVINFDPGTDEISNHKNGAFTDTLRNEQVTIIGFYSDQDHGIFTHHDSNVHLHFINEDFSKMGHIDQVELGDQRLKILIPKL